MGIFDVEFCISHRNVEEVKKEYENFYWEINIDEDPKSGIEELLRLTALRCKAEGDTMSEKALRRPPRILIMGPPGSGKTTLSRELAQKFGLIHVSAAELLVAEIMKKSPIAAQIEQLMKQGDLIPDEIMAELVKARLNAIDCKVAGWIMEGFPKTEAQITMLKAMKQTPMLIFLLELEDDLVYERHEYKKTNQVTGRVYNLNNEELLPKLEEDEQLVARECDRTAIVKKRLKAWKSFFLKDGSSAFLDNPRVRTLVASKRNKMLVDEMSELIESTRKEDA